MLEVEALFKTTKGKALIFLVKAVVPGEETARCKGPPFLVITSGEEGLFR
jgi:hypothetical protein